MEHQLVDFLVVQSNRFQDQPYCPRCGNSFIFFDTTFWICGEDKRCTIPLPFCSACEAATSAKKDLPMSIAAQQAFDTSGWKQAYIAALFETDKQKISSLITVAETAIVLRTRELFGAQGDHALEKAALDAALLGLHSLRRVSEGNNSSVRRVVAANDLAA